MPADTILGDDLLGLAGVTGTWAVLLRGKTKAEAAALYLDVVELAIAHAQTARRAVVKYTLDGQYVETSMDEAERLLAFLRRMKSTAGGGPRAMRVRFTR
jgi:hypothetical protein